MIRYEKGRQIGVCLFCCLGVGGGVYINFTIPLDKNLYAAQFWYLFRYADALLMKAEARRNVEGFSGAFWTELLAWHSEAMPHYIDYQLYPRVCALAEVCWLPEERRVWADFEGRLDHHKGRMEAMGIRYRQGEPAKPEGKVVSPKMVCTTSLPMRAEGDLGRISNYTNDYGVRSKRTCREGDWILYEFAERVPQGAVVELTTGYRHVTRGFFPSGVVEISTDGVEFATACDLRNGRATITATEPLRAIRIRCTTTGNNDPYVYIQHPVIRVVKWHSNFVRQTKNAHHSG